MDAFVGHGQEAVFLVRVRIDDRSSRHHVGVHIGGINGIGDECYGIIRKQFQYIAEVGLGAVRDEDLLRFERDPFLA